MDYDLCLTIRILFFPRLVTDMDRLQDNDYEVRIQSKVLFFFNNFYLLSYFQSLDFGHCYAYRISYTYTYLYLFWFFVSGKNTIHLFHYQFNICMLFCILTCTLSFSSHLKLKISVHVIKLNINVLSFNKFQYFWLICAFTCTLNYIINSIVNEYLPCEKTLYSPSTVFSLILLLVYTIKQNLFSLIMFLFLSFNSILKNKPKIILYRILFLHSLFHNTYLSKHKLSCTGILTFMCPVSLYLKKIIQYVLVFILYISTFISFPHTLLYSVVIMPFKTIILDSILYYLFLMSYIIVASVLIQTDGHFFAYSHLPVSFRCKFIDIIELLPLVSNLSIIESYKMNRVYLPCEKISYLPYTVFSFTLLLLHSLKHPTMKNKCKSIVLHLDLNFIHRRCVLTALMFALTDGRLFCYRQNLNNYLISPRKCLYYLLSVCSRVFISRFIILSADLFYKCRFITNVETSFNKIFYSQLFATKPHINDLDFHSAVVLVFILEYLT